MIFSSLTVLLILGIFGLTTFFYYPYRESSLKRKSCIRGIFSFFLFPNLKKKVYLQTQKQGNTTNIQNFFHLDKMVSMKADFRTACLDTEVLIKERIYPVCQICKLKIVW